jgi:hypothetical protein
MQDLCTNACKYCPSLKLIKLVHTHTRAHWYWHTDFFFSLSLSLCLSLCHGSTALVCLGLFIGEVSRWHSAMLRSVGLLWTSDWPVVETQRSRQTSMPQGGLNWQSQEASRYSASTGIGIRITQALNASCDTDIIHSTIVRRVRNSTWMNAATVRLF